MDDAALVGLYWARDERAIPATAEKYGAYCAAIARNILPDPQDAEECVSDAYLQAWNAIPPHRPAVFSAFLGKLTRNMALNRLQHEPPAAKHGAETGRGRGGAGLRGGGGAAGRLGHRGRCRSPAGAFVGHRRIPRGAFTAGSEPFRLPLLVF